MQLENSRVIISHIRKTEDNTITIQSNKEHSEGVADLAQKFASEFGMGDFGFVMGKLHDKGKEKVDFQNYIKRTSDLDPNAPSWTDKTHAYVGALLSQKLYGPCSNLMTNQIAGHHAGLYDTDELNNDILTKTIPQEINCDVEKTSLNTNILRTYTQPEHLHHLYRMLYSCLVDADFLDTERFMTPESYAMRGNSATMEEMLGLLQTKLDAFKNAPSTPVNHIRRQVQEECLKASNKPSGFFSLTVPTGGGKTISSVVWAVNHAIKNGKKRIIIAIPYTSIIVQTATVLKSIFGENNVLEHHSNANLEQCKDGKLRQQMKLATENWDYPIVVTTNVQLFESMFSNKPSACRKLHNICNSVLILDEVQTLPTDFLQPIVDALKCYQQHFGASVLFTTASQPILSGVIEGCNPKTKFKGIERITEIIPAAMNLHDALRRVKLEIQDGGNSYDEIAKQLAKYDKVLCIVNTRRDAKELYERLPKEETLHLSRMMCPAHVRSTIEKIKEQLANGEPRLKVIATQLIEAGVDIDFPVVYRQEAGLDSVLQAAGRCNREGKMDICTTHVFSLSKERTLPKGSMQDANNARKALPANSDWFAPETMTHYFEQLYCRRDTFDKKDMKDYLNKPREIYFRTASEEFQLIDDTTTPVIVNWENSMELVAQLKEKGPSYTLMKSLGQYTVSIRQNDFTTLTKAGQIEEVLDGIFVIEDRSQYSDKVGLMTDNHWLEETLII